MSDYIDEGSEMRPSREIAIRALVLEHVAESREAKVRKHRRKWFVWSGVCLLTVGLGSTAAGIVLQTQSVSNEHIVHCLSSEKRAADGSYPGPMASIASSDQKGRADDAVQVCSMMWEQGALDPGFDPTSTTNAPGRLPDAFVVCVMPDGSAAVVPSTNLAVCTRLGLASLEDN